MVEFVPAKKVTGKVAGLYLATGKSFVTEVTDSLVMDYEGIKGDLHAGHLRESGAREPWYPRGTEMRNERQLSILSQAELAEVAHDMDIDRLKSEWIGGNIELSGIAHLSLLPPRTLLIFEGGVTVRVDGDNGPCVFSGQSIADQIANLNKTESRDDLKFSFPKLARHRRGLVGWVERAGTIEVGEAVTARIWEQCIYPG